MEPVHFAAPFTITKRGVEMVEQASTQEIVDCVTRVCQCPEGFREDEPAFGIPELAFQTVPLSIAVLKSSIERWEPRAEPAIIERAITELIESERLVVVEV
jgi:hypothetical protein